MTNDPEENKVIVFRRAKDGRLSRVAAVPTGGAGTGTREVSPATPEDGVDPLASQGSLTLSRDGRFLFAVNAGSNTVSSFRIALDGRPTLVDVVPSGGAQPNSIDAFGSLVYVSNLGNEANGYASNVTGFHLAKDGDLTPIAGSTRSLSTADAQPARVAFSPEGSLLAVSELTTSRVSLFRVRTDGTLSEPTVNESSGPGPFGSVFLSTGRLLVSEAGANALSSYAVTLDGTLLVLSSSVPSTQEATCWVVATPDERFAFTSNTASGTITSYAISSDGILAVADAVAARLEGEAARPIDSGVSKDGRHFYVLDGGQGAIAAFQIESDGRLTLLQTLKDVGLPELGAQGLAVR
ncbi:MAG: beta-propeller fold lactonase family protein [Firmicutes bacterium]|nr:beta-propeller fold lactonase family protein [Bacillota bacterium]